MGVYIANIADYFDISFVIYNYNPSVLKFIYFLGLDAENIYRFTKRSKTLLTIAAFVSLRIRQPALQALRVCALMRQWSAAFSSGKLAPICQSMSGSVAFFASYLAFYNLNSCFLLPVLMKIAYIFLTFLGEREISKLDSVQPC